MAKKAKTTEVRIGADLFNVPVEYIGRLRNLINDAAAPPKPIKRETRVKLAFLRKVETQIKVLAKDMKVIAKENNRLEEHWNDNLSKADAKWVDDATAPLEDILCYCSEKLGDSF